MNIRKKSERVSEYEVLSYLSGDSFTRTYLVQNSDRQTFFMVEWEKDSLSSPASAELNGWLSAGSPYPEIQKSWEESGHVYAVLPEFQAVNILHLLPAYQKRLSKEELISLFAELAGIFEQAYAAQINPLSVNFFSQKIYKVTPGGFRVLPVPLLEVFKAPKRALDSLQKNLSPLSPKIYIQILGELFFFMLTQRFPKRRERPFRLTRLALHQEELVQRMIEGQVEAFENLSSQFSAAPKLEPIEELPPRERLEPASARTSIFSPAADLIKKGKAVLVPYHEMKSRILISRPIDEEEFYRFTYSLAVMLGAGISLPAALQALSAQAQNIRLKQAIQQLHKVTFEQGRSLSSAMEQQPDVFPKAYVKMIEAGEASGQLPKTLDEVAKYLEGSVVLKQKIKSATTYPLFVCAACVGLFSFFYYVVLPQVVKMAFQGFHADYPLPTQILLTAMNATHSYVFFFVFILVLLSCYPLYSFYRSDRGQEYADALKLKLPVIGPLHKNILLTEFCSSLASLLRTGVSFGQALGIAGGVSGSRSFDRIAVEMQDQLVKGASLTKIVGSIPFYPALIRSMVSVGEQSGKLDIMLKKASLMYQGEVDSSVERLLDLLEPAIVIAMGLVVGFVVTAVFLPIYSAVSSASQ